MWLQGDTYQTPNKRDRPEKITVTTTLMKKWSKNLKKVKKEKNNKNINRQNSKMIIMRIDVMDSWLYRSFLFIYCLS